MANWNDHDDSQPDRDLWFLVLISFLVLMLILLLSLWVGSAPPCVNGPGSC